MWVFSWIEARLFSWWSRLAIKDPIGECDQDCRGDDGRGLGKASFGSLVGRNPEVVAIGGETKWLGGEGDCYEQFGFRAKEIGERTSSLRRKQFG